MYLNKTIPATMMLVCSIILFLPCSSFAHKVMIFGWVEGDMVHTISKFSGSKKVKNAPVFVFDTEGNLILTGKTDTRGEFSFKMPKKTGLKIVLEASMGHKASCLIPLAGKEEAASFEDDEIKKNQLIKADYPLTEKKLEKIIEKVLDKKMALILRKIAEKEEKQTITEIISGFGYILGLVGIALWIKNRNV